MTLTKNSGLRRAGRSMLMHDAGTENAIGRFSRLETGLDFCESVSVRSNVVGGRCDPSTYSILRPVPCPVNSYA